MNLKQNHGIYIGRYSSDFKAETSMGTIKFHEWLERFLGYIFYPADLLFVTTELGTVANYYLNLLNAMQNDCLKCGWLESWSGSRH
jgi:alkyl hydroperoxide reductase subunit AhpC